MNRILITGSQTWRCWDTIEQAILDHAPGYPQGEDVLIVHGACGVDDEDVRGADAIADTLAATMGLPTEAHRADWDTCAPVCKPAHRRRRRNGSTYCPAAGLRRSRHMVSLGAVVCLAFIDSCVRPRCRKPRPHGSHGATYCADVAERAGIPTVRYTSTNLGGRGEG